MKLTHVPHYSSSWPLSNSNLNSASARNTDPLHGLPQVIPQLVSLLERGHIEERHGACGALYGLAQSEKHINEVISNRVINASVNLLSGEHERSRQPAAQLLAFLAQASDLVVQAAHSSV